jgi:hypothetical protein
MRWDLIQIGFRKHHNGLRMIANEPANLHMRTLADDDGLVALPHEHGESLVSLVYKGAGRIGDLATTFSPRDTVHIGGSVGRDDDMPCLRTAQIVKVTSSGADGAEVAIDERIVDELTEDGDGLALGGFVRGAEGVTHAEAHAVMDGEEDVHGVCWFTLWRKVIGCSSSFGLSDSSSQPRDAFTMASNRSMWALKAFRPAAVRR